MSSFENVFFNTIGSIKKVRAENAQPSDFPLFSTINIDETDAILCMTIITTSGRFEPCYLSTYQAIQLKDIITRILEDLKETK